MEQKFRKLSFVQVCKEMPEHKSHFPTDFTAIIEGSYSQLYGGGDIKSYALYKYEDGRVVGSSAWYDENELTQVYVHDRDTAEDMIEDYKLK